MPHKKTHDILPLTTRAIGYLGNAWQENELPGFYDYTDHYSNCLLQRLGWALGLTMGPAPPRGPRGLRHQHRAGRGKAEVLQKLLDHKDSKTTRKYVHVDGDTKRAAIAARKAAQFTA
ncbi:hypothetical protein [Hymenobacter sp. BT559]|uniref:hypothetical protein n=1 Tax=Hymenobacter sp. BT559 TaxID=2795729 RepID=UPI0018ED27FB|nr:hypothetical protein [Hymenobacter sp. BT559]